MYRIIVLFLLLSGVYTHILAQDQTFYLSDSTCKHRPGSIDQYDPPQYIQNGWQTIYYDHKSKVIYKRTHCWQDSITFEGWYRNGKPRETERIGFKPFISSSRTAWFADGKIKEHIYMLNDTLACAETFYKSGKKEGRLIFNSKGKLALRKNQAIALIRSRWYENGQVEYIDSANYRVKHLQTWYYPDGKKSKEVYRLEKEMTGKYTAWYPNDKLEAQGSYQDRDEDPKAHHRFGFKIGTWTYYDNKGQLIKTEIYGSEKPLPIPNITYSSGYSKETDPFLISPLDNPQD
ncbi:MAG TPA: hypothetical protein VNZ86_17425 [Bacteroidia bacterium]|jgi:hypothetical protein|nr:hypothetical protein [Bacteroidia bacterium]